jgi:VanZ like family
VGAGHRIGNRVSTARLLAFSSTMDRASLGTRKLARVNNERRSMLNLFRYVGLGGLIVIGILSAVPGELRPHVFAVPQLEHFVAYFAAGLLLALGFWDRRSVFLLCLAVPIYAAVLEIAQLFIPGRSSEFIDFLASSAGAWAGIVLAWLLHSARRLRANEVIPAGDPGQNRQRSSISSSSSRH